MNKIERVARCLCVLDGVDPDAMIEMEGFGLAPIKAEGARIPYPGYLKWSLYGRDAQDIRDAYEGPVLRFMRRIRLLD